MEKGKYYYWLDATKFLACLCIKQYNNKFNDKKLSGWLMKVVTDLNEGIIHPDIKDALRGPYRVKKYKRMCPDSWKKLKAKIFERDNYTCVYCGKRGAVLECDHIIPVSRGGDDSEENLATSCVKCNRSKSNKLLDEWGGAA